MSFYEGYINRTGSRDDFVSVEAFDRLAHKTKAGNKRAERELTGYLAEIAIAITTKHHEIARSRGIDIEDLRQDAIFAMLKGLESWDSTRASYRTVAFNRGRWAVLDSINGSHVVSISKGVAEEVYNGRKSRIQNPAIQVAAEAAIGRYQPIAGDDVYVEGEKKTHGTTSMPTFIEDGYEQFVEDRTLAQTFEAAGLTEREKEALSVRFSYGEGESMTMVELAAKWGVSGPRAYYIVNKAVGKLRARAVAGRRQVA